MKKIILLLLIALTLPLASSARKIVTDEVDEFSGTRTLITNWECICNWGAYVRFRLECNVVHFDYKMHFNGAIVIQDKAKLLFKSTTDSITSFSACDTYTGGRGQGAVGSMGSGNWGIYASYIGDISWFRDNTARLLRVNTIDGYIDKEISEGDAAKITALYNLFNEALAKPVGKLKN